MTVRVVLADDHAAIRSGLRLLLDTGGIEVVGEASDGGAAVRNTRALRPDVVVMDVRMPGMDGIEATRTIVAEGLAQVLVLTTFDLDDYVFGALRAGAAGFLLKTATSEELCEAVGRIAAGESSVSPSVLRRVLDAFAGASAEPGEAKPGSVASEQPGAPGLAELTPREREVTGLLGRGLSNAEIAGRLHISEATAKTHVSRVLAKLGCSSRMQASVIAREAGLR